MTLPMRLRDTFAQRILAFCRLSLERIYVKKGSFHRAAPSLFLPFSPFESEKLALFLSKLINFFNVTLTYFGNTLIPSSPSYSARDEFVGRKEKEKQGCCRWRFSSYAKEMEGFPRREAFERFENLHSRLGGVPPFQLLPQSRALSGRGEDFTSVVALSNVVAPSKTVCKRRCLLRGQCY